MDMPQGAKTQNIKGKVYVFIDTPFWNADKQRGEHKRHYIGKLQNGAFIPNGKYLLANVQSNMSPELVSVTACKRSFYGATYLLDQIGKKLGITADLKAAFPKNYKKIMSLCYFLVLEEGLSAYRFRKWGLTHTHPYNKDLSSQRISDLFASIQEANKMEFFRRQAKRRSEKEFLAYDTSSISSYSKLIKMAKYGKNKEGDRLPQINLALLYGEISRLPVYYRRLAGNTADVSTLINLLKDIGFLNMEKLNFVMDRGFFSEKNINELMKYHHKFLIGVRCNLKIVRKHLDEIRGELVSWKNYHDDIGLYAAHFTEAWDYQEKRPRSGEIVKGKRRVYIHIYFNDQRCTDERLSFAKHLHQLQEELVTGNTREEHTSEYARYFEGSDTPKHSRKVVPKEAAIKAKQKNFGYFALMSNGIKDPVEAIKVYRTRDLVEKAYANLKERLDMRRMSVASDEHFEGKLFIQFVSLIYLSYIKYQMEKHGLYKNYTMQTLLDDLDIIELYHQPGKNAHLSEITKKQRGLFEAMEIDVPA